MKTMIGVTLLLGFAATLPACGGISEGSNGSAGGSSVGGRAEPDGAAAGATAASAGRSTGVSGGLGAGATGSLGSADTGGAGFGGSGPLPDELPKMSVLGELSKGDTQKLCAEAGIPIARAVSGACLEYALASTAATFPFSDTQARFLCRAIYDSCLAEQAPAAPCPTFAATCKATVGEYLSCVGDASSGYTNAYSALPSCDAISVALLQNPLPGLPEEPPEPASCATVDKKCPDAPSAP